MKIKLSKYSGFCWGVKRAINTVKKIARHSKKVQTFGPLVHNAHELDRLRSMGIVEINELSEIDEKFPVVIRAHGISPSVEKELRERCSRIIDATCPLVKKIHGIVNMLAKNGYFIIIKGDIAHPEVKGILGHAIGKAIVVKDYKEAEKINVKADKIALVAQSTEIPEEFERIADSLKKKYPKIRIFDTICTPTKLAKSSAIKLAKESDLMIVIGGKNSSNTRKLTKVCSKHCSTIQIAEAKELSAEMVRNFNRIGITAGASTPDYIVNNVIKKLKQK